MSNAPTPDPAAQFAELALACVHREYPNKIAHSMAGDQDARPPRELTPAFYGCYDWHSAVHGHWLLARYLRLHPDTPLAVRARQALERSISPEHVAKEVAYLTADGRATFERPYGLAWLLTLGMELREMKSPLAPVLAPLEQAAAARVKSWLPKLSHPIRTGEHNQTAFSLGLMLDWARSAPDREFENLLTARARSYYFTDRACPVAYEPSGEDFLSPCLAEADLMRRVLAPAEFAAWFDRFLPDLAGYRPQIVTDPTDGKLAHLDGLNLSRTWMLEGIAGGLPGSHKRLAQIRSIAAAHRETGLKSVSGVHYEGSHWLGTFALYLTSGRGLGTKP
jgi:hypothetical protein